MLPSNDSLIIANHFRVPLEVEPFWETVSSARPLSQETNSAATLAPNVIALIESSVHNPTKPTKKFITIQKCTDTLVWKQCMSLLKKIASRFALCFPDHNQKIR
jgi:hypothetical protein